jgi:hypothetical protein
MLDQSNPGTESPTTPTVPAGTPSWITLTLIERTLAAWQPYYQEPLTTEDAVAMILAASYLLPTQANPVTDREVSP